MTKYKVTFLFNEAVLGTAPLNKELYSEFIASKAENGEVTDDEIESIPETIEKGTTGFHRGPDGRPVIYDYVIKGVFKDAAGMLRRVPGTRSAKLTAYKKVIDGLVFVSPRQIPVTFSQGQTEVGILERPLRAQTPQGERVALARSEMIDAGASMEFTLNLLDPSLEPLVREWLEYGELRGLGQWRNGGWGRYSFTMTEVLP